MGYIFCSSSWIIIILASNGFLYVCVCKSEVSNVCYFPVIEMLFIVLAIFTFVL